MAVVNVTMTFVALFQLFAGSFFVGNPLALIIVTAFGQISDTQAETYVTDQKMATTPSCHHAQFSGARASLGLAPVSSS